jgi:hypothetical protein
LEQTSLVHGSLSLQLIGVKKHPLGPHWSVVHRLPSLQTTGVFWHWPFIQASFVQMSLSLQFSGVEMQPLGPQASIVQGLPSLQLTGLF